MKESQINESIRRLVTAHHEHDETSFRAVTEHLIRELVVANRHLEARKLQEALIKRNGSKSNESAQTVGLTQLRRTNNALISWQENLRSRSDVILSRETALAFDQIVAEHRSIDSLRRHGLRPANKLLFWGPPGCGKTISASALASELGLPFGIVRLSSVITSYVGETSANIAKIFQEASSTSMVLLFDEADALAKDREDPNDVGELKRVVNSLLQCLDEFTEQRSVVIFASNHQHMFDSAVWRRFDEIVEFPLPNSAQRLGLLRLLTNGVQVSGNLETTARKFEGLSYADIERVTTRAIKQLVLAGEKQLTPVALQTLALHHRKQRRAAIRRSN